MISWLAHRCIGILADVPQSDEEFAAATLAVLALWDDLDSEPSA